MLRRMVVASLLCGAAAKAQDTPNPNAAGGTSNNPQGTNNPQSSMDRAARVLFPGDSRAGAVSGRVLLSDGSVPSETVRVQRVCGLRVAQEAYTDSEGRFSFFLGGSGGSSGDASVSNETRGGGGGGGGRGGGASSDTSLWGCELRAVLRGYRSEAMPVGVRHQDDGSDVGTIFLHSISKSRGLTMSATTGLAPKEAQKSYEKGLEAVKHSKPDLAQTEFLHAVGLYVRFAAAWFELGKILEQRGHRAEARSAYARAVASDDDFLGPYERLYLLDILESKWQEAVDATSRVLRRDPYEFPGAYYVSALANLQLGNLDAAERSAREAARVSSGEVSDSRASYVLGLVFARQGRLMEAAEALRTFLNASPGGAEQKDAERVLASVETRIRNRAARQNP